jgi:hypothetical protein
VNHCFMPHLAMEFFNTIAPLRPSSRASRGSRGVGNRVRSHSLVDRRVPGVEIETDSRSDYGVRRKGLFSSLLNFDGYSGNCRPLVEGPRVL